MTKLDQLGVDLNAYKFQFDDRALDEIRMSYRQDLEGILSNVDNQNMLEGGSKINSDTSSDNYYLATYGINPLLWFSCNNKDTYELFKRFYDYLRLDKEVKKLIDCDIKTIMYCGFFVVGDRAPNPMWHLDYAPGANAYTLITPLFDLDEDHGHLLYEAPDKTIKSYEYKLNEAIIFGDHFLHTTEPYQKSIRKRVLLSMTFGTDKREYWPILRKTIGDQSKYMMLPCGHIINSCDCNDVSSPNNQNVQRNLPCHCGSGKRYKYCHGKIS